MGSGCQRRKERNAGEWGEWRAGSEQGKAPTSGPSLSVGGRRCACQATWAERELGRVHEGRTGLRGRWVSWAGKGMWAACWEGKVGRRERKRAGLGWAAGWFRFFFF